MAEMATMTVKLSNEQTALKMLFEAGRLALEYRTGHTSEYTPDGFASLEPLRFAVTRAGELLADAENEERNLVALTEHDHDWRPVAVEKWITFPTQRVIALCASCGTTRRFALDDGDR